jgi:hypothetical protein
MIGVTEQNLIKLCWTLSSQGIFEAQNVSGVDFISVIFSDLLIYFEYKWKWLGWHWGPL